METKHTRGEWKLNSDFCVVNGTSHYVGEIYGTNPERYESIASVQCCSHLRNQETTIHREEAEANAKLIAAAPELLEALIRVESIYSEIERLVDGEVMEMLKSVRVAIKKATE